MEKVIFVCHGNICRSPMAEYIAKYLDKEGRYEYISRAISNEEKGNDIYPPAKAILIKNHIPYSSHAAKKITLDEFKEASHIFVMDQSNLNYLKLLFPYENFAKVKFLHPFQIDDPWYTGDFETVYKQIYVGIEKFLKGESF